MTNRANNLTRPQNQPPPIPAGRSSISNKGNQQDTQYSNRSNQPQPRQQGSQQGSYRSGNLSGSGGQSTPSRGARKDVSNNDVNHKDVSLENILNKEYFK